MVWKYRLVEFGVDDRRELTQLVDGMRNSASRKANNELNWEEKQKGMTHEEQKKFANEHIYPLGDKFFKTELEKELGTDLSHLHLTTKQKIALNQVNYLELLINKYAAQGWELDRIRNFKNQPDNGYLVLKREG